MHGETLKTPLFLSDFKESWIFSTDIKKNTYSNIKFHENPSSESRQTDGQTDEQIWRKWSSLLAILRTSLTATGF